SESVESTPEVAAETMEEVEQGGDAISGESEGAVQAPAPSAASQLPPSDFPPAPVMKDPLTQQVEEILEEDLAEAYKNLPKNKKQEFKRKGEEAAMNIQTMIASAKFSAKKALHMIRKWLLIIPGINKFFLEQEAKIKADKLSDIVERITEDKQNHT
ncbi:MAG: hypothetical protein O2877_02385, partial [bacterium]|nr:hypothetical protein [bacterium]